MGMGTATVDGLDLLEPGAELGALLAAIDSSSLSAHDRVTVLKAHQKMVAHHQALSYREMAAIVSHFLAVDDDFELAYEAASAEIAAALHLSRRAADYEVDVAWEITGRLPQVGERLAQGRIDLRRVRAFVRGTCHLDDDAATEIVVGALTRAERMTAGQLEALLRRQCFQLDPDAAKKRYLKAVADRRVLLEADESGAAQLLGLDLPSDLAARAMARICGLAEAARTPGDDRTVDQLRADVYLDLLLEGGNGKKQGVINLHVDLETLTRLSETPGELAGYGPVIADIARQIAEAQTRGQWRYTIDDLETGQPLANGLTRRRPTTAQRRRVETLHPVCVHPGCRNPAINADLDHIIAYGQGGPTRASNFGPLCRYHHNLKTRGHWQHHRLPNGDHQFRSRLGHHYTTSGRSP